METNLRVLSDNEIAQVHERTLSILAAVGVRVDTAQGRKILKKAGADVSNDTHVVRFPRDMIEKSLQHAPHQFTLGGRAAKLGIPVKCESLFVVADGGASYIIDDLDRQTPQRLLSRLAGCHTRDRCHG